MEDCDDLIIDFSNKELIKTIKKKFWVEESKMEKIIKQAAEEPTQNYEKEDKERIDLNNVSGHEAYTYEFMLSKIAKEVHGQGISTGSAPFKLIEPKCARTATRSSWVNFGK